MNPMIISALISAGQGALGASSTRSQRKAQGEADKPYADFQNRKNNLIDELLASLEGNGKYSSLFETDEDAFQKSFVDPAKSMFKNQIAPQIQQGTIASGLQDSSNLTDQLSRAGIDMDQMLNQSFMDFQNQGKDRALNTINSIFGAGAPAQQTAPETPESSLYKAGGQFLAGDPFNDFLASLGKKKTTTTTENRPGFTN